MTLVLLTEEEIRDSVDMTTAIDAIEGAFAALGRGAVTLPPPIGLDIPEVEAEIHVKGAHIHGADELYPHQAKLCENRQLSYLPRYRMDNTYLNISKHI